jgi:isopentenyldiphosphate isomerase
MGSNKPKALHDAFVYYLFHAANEVVLHRIMSPVEYKM